MKPKQTSETEKADIVERLRAWSGACLTPDQVIQCAPSITNILREAAAEIERLRALPSRSDVLEEAARVADDWGLDVGTEGMASNVRRTVANHIAKAIRALKSKDTDNG
jgi:hypothetical protein